MKNIIYLFIFSGILGLNSCLKYSQPSSPKLSGEWRFDQMDYMRIENDDTLNPIVYSPGDIYTNSNDKFPLDSINIGFTRISMDYGSIRFNPIAKFGGGTDWLKTYFHTVTEVNNAFPGFLCFETEFGKNVWKIVYTDYETMILQFKGEWDPNSLGFFALQSADNYDVLTARFTRVGP